jgi:hypothetical protein
LNFLNKNCLSTSQEYSDISSISSTSHDLSHSYATEIMNIFPNQSMSNVVSMPIQAIPMQTDSQSDYYGAHQYLDHCYFAASIGAATAMDSLTLTEESYSDASSFSHPDPMNWHSISAHGTWDTEHRVNKIKQRARPEFVPSMNQHMPMSLPSSFPHICTGEPGAAPLARRKRVKYFKHADADGEKVAAPKGVYSTGVGAYRVQLNKSKGSSRKFSKNVPTFHDAVWMYEAAVLMADRPRDLQHLMSIGNYHCILGMKMVRCQGDYYTRLVVAVPQLVRAGRLKDNEAALVVQVPQFTEIFHSFFVIFSLFLFYFSV